MLLIVTNKQDTHSDEVIRRLAKRGMPIFRLNTEDIVQKYQISLRIDVGGRWNGTINDELGRQVDLDKLRVAWIRRPDFSFEGATDGVQKFIVSEIRALIASLYALPNIAFVNEVFDSDRAKTKFQQLILASKLGVRTPRTLITNNPLEAKKFAEQASGDLLIKVVYTGNVERDGVKQGIPSRKVSPAELIHLSELVKNAPTQMQEYVEKQYELRVTIVGRKALPSDLIRN